MMNERAAGSWMGRGRELATALVVRPLPVLLIFASLCAIFLFVLHPWMMTWGSSPGEQAMALPGDSASPAEYFTRAISIDAPLPDVWPWLLAIGQDRGGFLSNDWLETFSA